MKQSLRMVRLMGITLILVGAASAEAKKRPPKNIISMAVARTTAIDSMPGKVESEELEYEGGKWIYSFDLKSAEEPNIHEVQVDALSGKVVSNKVESASDESKEKKEDKKTRRIRHPTL